MNSQQLKDLRLPGQLKLHSMGLVRALIPESARSFTSAFDVTRNEDNTSDGVPSENSRIGRAPGYQSLESRYSEPTAIILSAAFNSDSCHIDGAVQFNVNARLVTSG